MEITILQNSYPIYKMDEQLYIREEIGRNYSLNLVTRPELSLITINKMAKIIMDYCTGGNSVFDIISMIKQEFIVPETEDVSIDVGQTLHILWGLNVLSFKGDNLFIKQHEKKEKDYKIRYLIENEIKKIQWNEFNYSIVNPYLDVIKEYTPIEIGSRWFNGSESFFSVEYDDVEIFRIGIRINQYLKIYEVSFVEFNSIEELVKLFSKVISFAHSIYKDILSYDLFDGGEPVIHIYSTKRDIFDALLKIKGKMTDDIKGESIFVYEYLEKEGGEKNETI